MTDALWASQTTIGDKFGISGIKIGKILIAAGLKHPNTNKPTTYALDNGFAKKPDYYHYFNRGPLWNSDKIEVIINKSHPYLQRDEYYTYRIESTLKQDRCKHMRNDVKQIGTYIYGAFHVPKDVSYAKMIALLNAAIRIEKKNVRNAICSIITEINLSSEAVAELRTVVKMYHSEYIDLIDKVLLIK